MFGLKSCAIKVELLISCSELLNKDITSKSDPLCLVELQDNISKKWHEVGRTERIVNSLNPNFSKRIKLEYLFEEVQNVRFMVYDIDNETSSLDDDDFLGKVESTLGQIVSQKKKSMLLSVKKRQHGSDSKITVVAEEINDNRVVSFNIKASNLDNKDFLGKSDPYLEIWKQNHGGETDWALSHRTEVIKNTLNPLWKPFSVPFHALCGESSEAKLKFVCYDWDSDGSHDLIGEFYTTFAEVQDGNSSREFPCINPKKKKKKKSYTNSGVVTIVSCETRRDYSFLDYIFGGLQLNFTVGVDFTGSNGDPRSPTSLHFINPTQPNHYMQTLRAVGAVIQDYDHDKFFPAFGFGAKLATGEVSHEFALNFNPTNPYCAGVEGIVDAYKLAIPQVQLWGPTCIAPIINHVARFAQQACNSNYFVLLIVTDGVITDMDETKSAIVYASRLPMSIIIVGVGEADFSAMEELDGDDGVLRSATGQPVSRDIVQFVPFRQFRTSQQIATLALSKAVLAELPTQVTGYYKSHKIVPGNYAAADAPS